MELDIGLDGIEPNLDLVDFSQITVPEVREKLKAIVGDKKLGLTAATDVARTKADLKVKVKHKGREYTVGIEYAADECWYYGLRHDQQLFPLYPPESFESPETYPYAFTGNTKFGKVNGTRLHYEPQFELELKDIECNGRVMKKPDEGLRQELARLATQKVIDYCISSCPDTAIFASGISKGTTAYMCLDGRRDQVRQYHKHIAGPCRPGVNGCSGAPLWDPK
ncbi:MAG: hypothetical protein GC131_02165 [Alphaproteobacteria bacterium]|nr:hypothetical protein [Alphaproteobacteria bacterium]